MHQSKAPRSEYRPDIDGLRSIAVLSVFLFHLQPALLPGGFLGVDVFFVISGYLITKIILRENHLHTFSFIHFYTRRVKRIFPALFVVLILSAGVATLLLPPETYTNFMVSARYASGQLANFFFARKVGYFNEGFSGQPQLHTWSLGVEEQFYLFWPLLIVCCFLLFNRSNNRGHDRTAVLPANSSVSGGSLSGVETLDAAAKQAVNRKIAVMMLLLSIVSFAACYVLAEANYNQAFYMFYTRAFEFCIGAFISLNIVPAPAGRGGNRLSGGLGLFLLFYSFLFIKEEFLGISFLQFGVVLPCLGAALIIYTDWRQGTFNRMLASALPRFIGKISYSLYLYHWPVIIFWKLFYSTSIIGAKASLLIIIVSFILATLSYLLVEQPARKTTWPDRRVLVAALAVVIIFATGFKNLEQFATAPWRITGYRQEQTSLPADDATACAEENRNGVVFYRCSERSEADVPIIALVGDSHGPHFIYGTLAWAEKHGYNVKYNVFAACPMLLGDVGFDSVFGAEQAAGCRSSLSRFQTEIVDDPQVEIVLIAQRFGLFHTGRGYASPNGFITFKDRDGKTIKDYNRYYIDQMTYTVEAIKEKGKKLIFLKQVPLFDGAFDCNWEPLIKKVLKSDRECVYDAGFIKKWQQPSIEFIDRFAAGHGVEILDPMPFFKEPLYRGNNLYLNKDHLNEIGKHYLVPYFVEALDELLAGRATVKSERIPADSSAGPTNPGADENAHEQQ
jgi:peptidoglycan/LPS O-acetylase OafA/YrhL